MEANARREFLKQGSMALAAGLVAPLVPGLALAGDNSTEVIILHTNDTHSRLDPFPLNDKRHGGMGGVTRRAAMVEEVRANLKPNQHLLLLDSGDMVQGTPYFNFFAGEPEMKAMSAMGYAASTLGNHDFDNGLAGLTRMLTHANFPILNINYDFTGTNADLRQFIKPYQVFNCGPVKVGVFGVGIAFEGLVLPGSHGLVRYQDPLPLAKEMVQHLKRNLGCHYVICLSHLGLTSVAGRTNDRELAKACPGLDLILGGHTHTFMEAPERVIHTHEQETLINQVGWAGIWLGQLTLKFGPAGKAKTLAQAPMPVQEIGLG